MNQGAAQFACIAARQGTTADHGHAFWLVLHAYSSFTLACFGTSVP